MLVSDRNMKSSREHNTHWRKQAKAFANEELKIEELIRDVNEFIAKVGSSAPRFYSCSSFASKAAACEIMSGSISAAVTW